MKPFTKISLSMVSNMHQDFKVKCAQEGVTMRSKLIGMIGSYLKGN